MPTYDFYCDTCQCKIPDQFVPIGTQTVKCSVCQQEAHYIFSLPDNLTHRMNTPDGGTRVQKRRYKEVYGKDHPEWFE
jgi:hypothetical protein